MFTAQVRDAWMEYRCCDGVPLEGGFFGRTTVWCANEDVAKMYKALEAGHYGSGYVPTEGGYIGSKRHCPAGIGGKTCQPDGKDCSLHNYCLALDIEYQYNKTINTRITEEDFDEDWFPSVCKYTLEQVRAIEGIKTTKGTKAFTWLGWALGDFMHWQINVKQDDTTIDWNTVPSQDVGDDDMDDFIQAVFDRWSWDDLESMRQAGMWRGDTDYFKGPGANPAWVDVENLTLELIANAPVFASYEDAEVIRRGDSVTVN